MAKQQPPQDVPVYLFTGFLESGKSTFIQETLEDPRFNTGEQTLLLLCEEGEVEFDPSKFASPNVACRVIESEEELTPEHLNHLLHETKSKRVVCEYNGMWLLDRFYSNMPPAWAVYQEFFFADARSILTYNANMRQLTFDKLQSCELAVFNRFDPTMDRMEFHKLVRTASRRAEIVYEHADGKIEYDEIEDPLPFDIEAPVIEIADTDYAIWYRDLQEDTAKYDGKTVKFTGRALTRRTMPGAFVIGRHVMTCCVEDIQFAALVCTWDKAKVKAMASDQWVTVTAKLEVKFHPSYGGKGPVLTAQEVAVAQKPEQEVATFF
ncbi:MAG: GTPase [Oscillospiraceae bacterium]|nr:GTPase [Oscillospiraceae bacterium]